jgi:hypothetical protein
MIQQVFILIFVTAIHVFVSVKESFVVDEDLVKEMTEKQVHVKLYHEFANQANRRPTQDEYDDMIHRYQLHLKTYGRHPDIEKIAAETYGKKDTWITLSLRILALLIVLGVLVFAIAYGVKQIWKRT